MAISTVLTRSNGIDSSLTTVNTAQSPFSIIIATHAGTVFVVDSSAGTIQFNLPAPVANTVFTIKDDGGNFANFPITVHRFASEQIENLDADFICESAWGTWNFICNGTKWYLL